MSAQNDYEAYKDEIQELTERVDRVLKYIDENPNSDPNAYEMMELTSDIGAIQVRVRSIGQGSITNPDITKGYEYAQSHKSLTNLRTKYFKMMDIRLQQMQTDAGNLGLSENSPLYKLLSNKRDNMISYNEVATGKEKEMLCRLAGMSLYQKQCKRDRGYHDDIYPTYEQIRQIEGYYTSQKPVPEHEREVLSELLCIFLDKNITDEMLGENVKPIQEIVSNELPINEDISTEKSPLGNDNIQPTFVQKMAKKIASNRLLSKLPFMNKFVQKHINMIEGSTEQESVSTSNIRAESIQQNLASLKKDEKDIDYTVAIKEESIEMEEKSEI